MLPPDEKRRWAKVETLLCDLEEEVSRLPLDARLSIGMSLKGLHILVDQWRKEEEHFARFKQDKEKDK